jgi:colicin import membrane protein
MGRVGWNRHRFGAMWGDISRWLHRATAPLMALLPEKWRGSPWTHSILLHVILLLLLLSGGLWWPSDPVPDQVQPVIRAHAVDEAQVQEAMQQLRERERAADEARRKAAEQAKLEQKRLADLKKQRAEEQKKLAAEKKARQEAEKKRLALERAAKEKADKEKAAKAEAEKKKVEEKKKLEEQKKAEEQKKLEVKKREEQRKAEEKAARERELKAAMQAEEAARVQAAKEAAWLTASQQVQLQIQNKVRGKWQRPAGLPETAQVVLRVNLLPDGSVQSVELRKESGVTLFDQSALRAVQAASPLPIPDDRELFNAQFRQFEFTFTAAE